MPVLPRQDDGQPASPTSTSAPPADESVDAAASIYGEHNGLTDGQIGAIVGSIVGFSIIVFLLVCCVVNNRRRYYARHHHHHHHSRSSSGTSSMVGDPPVKKPPPVRVRESVRVTERARIPGGPRYPTYRAIPIPNPRKNPKVRHNV